MYTSRLHITKKIFKKIIVKIQIFLEKCKTYAKVPKLRIVYTFKLHFYVFKLNI